MRYSARQGQLVLAASNDGTARSEEETARAIEVELDYLRQYATGVQAGLRYQRERSLSPQPHLLRSFGTGAAAAWTAIPMSLVGRKVELPDSRHPIASQQFQRKGSRPVSDGSLLDRGIPNGRCAIE